MNTSNDIPEELPMAPVRVPPHSAEAEHAVIGSLLLHNGSWDRVGSMLTSRDFYARRHGTLFDVIGRLVAAGQPADVVTVLSSMGDRQAEEVGGLSYVNALAQCVANPANVGRYAEIVKQHSVRRAVIAACDRAQTLAWADGMDVSATIDGIGTLFAQIERGQQLRRPKSLAEIVPARLDRISALADGTAEPGIGTSISRLDRVLSGGLRAGGLYVLAARPGIGKSSFAQAIGLHVAQHSGPVLMLSQEMPDGEVADRALSSLGRLDFGAVQSGDMRGDSWQRLVEATEHAAALPFWVDDQPALRLRDMRRKARQVKGLRLLIVDYLQLSTGDGGDNRNVEIEHISRGLKALAKELGIPILLLSQLNRKVEERVTKEPQLSDLRDSGAIEQDADVVVFLWPARDLEGGAKLVGLKVDKNRQGVNGRFGLHFDGSRQRWGESEESVDRPQAAPKKRGFE